MLLVINSTISFIEENNAGNAAAALMAGLAPKTKVINRLCSRCLVKDVDKFSRTLGSNLVHSMCLCFVFERVVNL